MRYGACAMHTTCLRLAYTLFDKARVLVWRINEPLAFTLVFMKHAVSLVATVSSTWSHMDEEAAMHLFVSFVCVSLIGFVWETYVLGKVNARDGLLDWLFGRSATLTDPLPFLTIYGASYVVLTFVHPWVDSFHYPSLMASAVASTAECVLGEASFYWHGVASWSYPASWWPVCNGFASGVATLAWGGFYFAYAWVVHNWKWLYHPRH